MARSILAKVAATAPAKRGKGAPAIRQANAWRVEDGNIVFRLPVATFLREAGEYQTHRDGKTFTRFGLIVESEPLEVTVREADGKHYKLTVQPPRGSIYLGITAAQAVEAAGND